MPNRDPQEPQDPIEDDDLIGTGDDAEEADDEKDDEDEEDILDEEDDELDEDDEDDEEEEEPDEEAMARGGSLEGLTGEVGSEGGSPGDTVLQRRTRGGLGRGSEATTTWRGGESSIEELKDDQGVPIKRAP